MVSRVELIKKYDADHPLNQCSSAIKKYGYKDDNYMQEFEKCIYDAAIKNNNINFCKLIKSNDFLKDGCLLELDSNYKPKKENCLPHLIKQIKNINLYENEPLFTCLANKKISPINFDLYQSDIIKGFVLGNFILSDESNGYQWYANHKVTSNGQSNHLSIYQSAKDGAIHKRFKKIIDGEYKKNDIIQWPTKPEDPKPWQMEKPNELPVIKNFTTLEKLSAKIYFLELAYRNSTHNYYAFLKNNTFIIFEPSGLSFDGKSVIDLIDGFILNSFTIPKNAVILK
jgi:hypothetical protein